MKNINPIYEFWSCLGNFATSDRSFYFLNSAEEDVDMSDIVNGRMLKESMYVQMAEIILFRTRAFGTMAM